MLEEEGREGLASERGAGFEGCSGGSFDGEWKKVFAGRLIVNAGGAEREDGRVLGRKVGYFLYEAGEDRRGLMQNNRERWRIMEMGEGL